MIPGHFYGNLEKEWFYNTPIPNLASNERPYCSTGETFLFLKVENNNCNYFKEKFVVLKVLLHGQIKYIFRIATDNLSFYYKKVT